MLARSAGMILVLFASVPACRADDCGPPAGLGDFASTLPALPVDGGRVRLPLDQVAPFEWRPIRPGVTVAATHAAATKQLRVAYSRESGKASGAALVIPPGTLAGLQKLVLTVRGNRAQPIIVSLSDGAGLVYSFPAFKLPTDAAAPVALDAAELRYDCYQARTKDPGSFDPGRAILITLVDISGFLAISTFDVDYEISEVEAHVRAAAANSPTLKPSPRDPVCAVAEDLFFDALNDAPARRDEARLALLKAYAVAPGDARTALLLGMTHLWIAAEDDRRNAATIENVILAEHYLRRAAELNPGDDQLPSWHAPSAIALANIEGRSGDVPKLYEPLRDAAAKDPCFHSVAAGIMNFHQPRDLQGFRDALALLRQARACSGDDPSIHNRPRWPHNVQGFLVFLSDYELKAGERARAAEALALAEQSDGFETWPFKQELSRRRAELDARAALYSDADPANDPLSLLSPGNPVSCRACHQAR